MSLAERLPLVRPGDNQRNAIIICIAAPLLPLTLLILPFFLFFAIGTNHNGLQDALLDSRFRKLPGVSEGGWKAAGVMFGYTFFIAIVVLGALGSAPADTDQAEPDIPDQPSATMTATPETGGGDGPRAQSGETNTGGAGKSETEDSGDTTA